MRIFKDEVLVAAPFIDLSLDAGGPVTTDGNEMGLLGLAFHPSFDAKAVLPVLQHGRSRRCVPPQCRRALYCTDKTSPTTGTISDRAQAPSRAQPARPRVRCFAAGCGCLQQADPGSCVEILSIPDPGANHNGGMMEFGRDGYLYIATGDGGGNGKLGRSQDLTLLLGKMLRIDVDRSENGNGYGIPADNPYANGGGGAPELFMWGLRNP